MIDASRIAAIFDRFTTGWHFYLRDLRSGEEVELGIRQPWPIGSCFKLAVLVAYFEALSDGTLAPDSLDQETLIPPERFRVGFGIVNLLDSPIRLTDRHMLRWMLAASDGTATDILIAKLGLDRVDATLRRLAPSSHLACNLGDMVTGFRAIPGAPDCKTRDWAEGEADRFRVETAKLGATHAVDLAELALGAFTLAPPPREDYLGVLRTTRIFPRTEMFIQPALRVFSKTGSLGHRYFLQDCGVICPAETDLPVAIFGYCTQGMRLPTFLADVTMGLVGVEIAKVLQLAPTSNADWTPEGANLLLGDLWQGE